MFFFPTLKNETWSIYVFFNDVFLELLVIWIHVVYSKPVIQKIRSLKLKGIKKKPH
jgi:hypothetical protein